MFNSLKRKKPQLAKAGFTGLNGIILCDGDCSMLTSSMYAPTAYTLDNIVWDFLRQNMSIGFVLAIGIKAQHWPFGCGAKLSLVSKLFAQPHVEVRARLGLTDVFSAMI